MPATIIRLLPGTKIIPNSKRIYCMDLLPIQDAGSISILCNSHPDQEGIKGPLTGKNSYRPFCTASAICCMLSIKMLRLEWLLLLYFLWTNRFQDVVGFPATYKLKLTLPCWFLRKGLFPLYSRYLLATIAPWQRRLTIDWVMTSLW